MRGQCNCAKGSGGVFTANAIPGKFSRELQVWRQGERSQAVLELYCFAAGKRHQTPELRDFPCPRVFIFLPCLENLS